MNEQRYWYSVRLAVRKKAAETVGFGSTWIGQIAREQTKQWSNSRALDSVKLQWLHPIRSSIFSSRHDQSGWLPSSDSISELSFRPPPLHCYYHFLPRKVQSHPHQYPRLQSCLSQTHKQHCILVKMLTRPSCVLLLNTRKSCTRAWKFSGFDICSSSCLTLLTTPISIVLHVDFQTISPKSVSKTLELYKTIFYWIPKVPKKNDTQHIHNAFLYQVSFPIVHYLPFLPPVTFLSKLSLTLPSSPLPHSINFKSWKFSNLVFSKYVHLSLSSSLLFIWFQATSIPLF